jgi:hypothetical protein
MGGQPTVFVSYSHADTKWLRELDRHLRGLELYAKVERFDDRRLLGGDNWDNEVKSALDRADIILLLVTANFIGSAYIHRVELPTALKRREQDGSIVVPILCEDCARKLLAIDDINYLPKDVDGGLKPLAEWRGVQKTKGLTQITEHILAQIERLRARGEREAKLSRSSGIDPSVYRQRAQAKWSALDLSALARPGAVDPDIAIRLADVFVPQLARRSRPVVSLSRDYLEAQGINVPAEAETAVQLAGAWESLPSVSVLGLVAECERRHMVLLGDPGAGKSTLARFVVLQLLNDSAPPDSLLAALSGHVPFLIELRDFVAREAEGRCTDLLSYLAYCGRELGFGFDEKSLADQLSRRPSLLVIDGLDEIFDPRLRRLMVDQIIGLIGRYPKLRMLITSRIAGFDDTPFRGAEFTIATLIDLTSEQVQGFAKTWFNLVFPADPDAAQRARDDLLEAVTRRPQLRAIAGNPMILTIMATVARHRRLARSRAALYAQALELLCYTWDYKRGLGLPTDSPLVDLQADDTLLMLRRVAWKLRTSPEELRANAISEGSLRAVIEEFFKDEWRFDVPKARRASAEMLKRLEERNWVLTLRGPALYGFVHRTFLEYLCALELSERFKAQQLDIQSLIFEYVTPALDDDAQWEPLRLLVGLLPVPAAAQMLLAILPSESEISEKGPRLALAWLGLAEIEPRYIGALGQICVRLTEILYAWLAQNSKDDIPTAQQIVEAAEIIGRTAWPAPHPPDASWPSLAAGDKFSWLSIVGAFANTIWDCPDETVSVFEAACHDQDLTRRIMAIVLLATHFSTDPNGARVLYALAVEKGDKLEDEVQRGIALRNLGRIRTTAETKALLHARAVEDSHTFPRRAALDALAEHFRDDPETKSLLCSRTLEDADGGVRGAALKLLAEHFRDDPETKLLLRSRVLEDADGGWVTMRSTSPRRRRSRQSV